MLKFRSGTHGLNEELGRHRGREGKTECIACDHECDEAVAAYQGTIHLAIVGLPQKRCCTTYTGVMGD